MAPWDLPLDPPLRCLCVIALYNYVGSDTATFSANSNTRTCIQLRVADDDIYGTSPVPVYTVVLSIFSPNSRVTVGDISETIITVSDDDGMSVMRVNDLLLLMVRSLANHLCLLILKGLYRRHMHVGYNCTPNK